VHCSSFQQYQQIFSRPKKLNFKGFLTPTSYLSKISLYFIGLGLDKNVDIQCFFID